MSKSRRIKVGQYICVLSVIPALIYAHEYGPDPRYTGAPGDKGTCIQSMCHVGTVNDPANGGQVQIVLPGGQTYTPGVRQHIKVVTTDANRQSWGFQMTARLASDLSQGQAGAFSASDGSTQVICDDNSFAPCKTAPVQFIEHTLAGWSASTGKKGTYTYEFDWTPPATASENVTLYVAANASNSPNPASPNETTGHIYTSNVTLTPSSGGAKPVIAGVGNGASFLPTLIAPSTYITITGTNLASTSRGWASADFQGNKLPTSLDNTAVTVNGKPAYVNYVSPGQINAITPFDTASGSGIAVTVTANGVASDVATVTLQKIAPSFFAINGKYPAATHANGSTLASPSVIPGATPATPGETIILYGTGFGPTTPPIADGQSTDKVYNLTPGPTFTIGGAPAVVAFAGLVPPFAQVYQFNITVPTTAANGDLPLIATIGGVSTPMLSLTVLK